MLGFEYTQMFHMAGTDLAMDQMDDMAWTQKKIEWEGQDTTLRARLERQVVDHVAWDAASGRAAVCLRDVSDIPEIPRDFVFLEL